MMKGYSCRNRVQLLMLIVLLLSLMNVSAAQAERSLSIEEYQEIVSTFSINPAIPDYSDYLQVRGTERPDVHVIVNAADCVRYEGSSEVRILSDYAGMTGEALLLEESGLAEFAFHVPQSGLYDLLMTYYPYEGKGTDIQCAFFVDGQLCYDQMSCISFSRIWSSGFNQSSGWQKDNQGNDLKPSLTEQRRWMNSYLYDNNGYITDELSVWLDEGDHVLTILSLREPVLISSFTFANRKEVLPYAQQKALWDAQGVQDVQDQMIVLEGEFASATSSQTLYPEQDQSSQSVSPSSPKLLLNNTIGGANWKTTGQWIEWTFDIPEEGYYEITLYDKQNFVRGVHVNRKIEIDGDTPFAELISCPFAYSQSWRLETLGSEGVPYRFYLTQGTHTLRMQVNLGEMAQIIGQVQICMQRLNNIYREVLYITGVAPDQYRDYQIPSYLPELEGELVESQEILRNALAALEKTAGTNNNQMTALKTLDDQLTELIEDQDRFAKQLGSFKTNVRALGNWIIQQRDQPMQIDRIFIHAPSMLPEVLGMDFLGSAGYEMERVYYSFIVDYNQIGNLATSEDGKPVLTLWVGTGRDQANIIKSLIDEQFSPQTGIGVNLELVDMSTLLRATLSGQGPDIAIQVANTTGIAGSVMYTGNDTPVNYGLRNAVLDLTQFEDFEAVAERFADAALVPFSFDGATYALPETITFPMMFYRKDILAEIGLDIPKTWDDVKIAMTVLSKNQMEFGMLPSEQIFAMLLYQNGGVYYTENGDRSMLDSDTAVNVFKQYCEFYTDYRLDKATSAEERFRTGEAPIIITDYTTYNNLQVSAPDIYGLWGFTHVPGTVQDDGTISYATGASGLADIIMKDTEYPEACWEFLKWWTSAEVQTRYGREMEALMGASARVPTANLEAMGNLAWLSSDYQELMGQFAHVQGIPQVPGGYFSWRNVNNAFYSVTESKEFPREALMDKVEYINAEIAYKREELGLPVAEDE